VSVENDFVALVLSIVGLGHPLFQGVKLSRNDNGDFLIDPQDFATVRLDLLRGEQFFNLFDEIN
jgi:hypothetical protein